MYEALPTIFLSTLCLPSNCVVVDTSIVTNKSDVGVDDETFFA